MKARTITASGDTFSEAHHQAWCKLLLLALGWRVYDTSQGYRREAGGTRITPGLCDLIAFQPRLSLVLFFECKPPKQAREAERMLNLPLVPPSKHKVAKRYRAQRDFGLEVLSIAAATDHVLYGYGSLPELVSVLCRRFNPATLRPIVEAIGCPLGVKQRALVVLAPSAGGATGGAGDGAVADPLEE